MADMRDEVQRQIVGNVVKGRCSTAAMDLEWLDYSDSFCSGYAVVCF